MYTWSDMTAVKSNLWKKLHSAKQSMQDGVNSLAQIASSSSQSIIKMAKSPFEENNLVQTDDENVNLSQVESES
jgi:hypothetical protein